MFVAYILMISIALSATCVSSPSWIGMCTWWNSTSIAYSPILLKMIWCSFWLCVSVTNKRPFTVNGTRLVIARLNSTDRVKNSKRFVRKFNWPLCSCSFCNRIWVWLNSQNVGLYSGLVPLVLEVYLSWLEVWLVFQVLEFLVQVEGLLQSRLQSEGWAGSVPG